MGILHGEEAEEGAAEIGLVAQAHGFATGHVGPDFPGCLEPAEGKGLLGHAHQQGACGMDGPGQSSEVFHGAQEVGVAHQYCGYIAVQFRLQINQVRDTVLEAHFHQLQIVVRREVGLEHLAIHGVEAPAHQHGAALLGHAHGHQRRFHTGGAAIVEAGIGHLEARQVADERLVLKDVLERALADLGLVGRVGREPFLAADERVDGRGHEVIVGPGPEELGAEAGVPVGEAHHLPGHLLFGALGGQVQFAFEARRFRYAHQQRLGVGHANGVQEGSILDGRRGQVAHGGLGKER